MRALRLDRGRLAAGYTAGAAEAWAEGPGRAERALHWLMPAWLVLQLFYSTDYMPLQTAWVINITPDRVVLAAVAALFGLRVLADRASLLPSRGVEVMMAALSAVALISLVASGANADTSGGQNRWLSSLFAFLIVPYAAYFMARNLRYDDRLIKRYSLLFCLIGLYLGLTAVLEACRCTWLVFPGYIMDPALGIHFGRARGPMLNAGFLGQLLVFCFFMTLLAWRLSRGAARAVCAAGVALMLAGIYFTYTRGPWLGLAAGLGVLLAARSGLRRYALVCCCLIVAVALLGVASRLSFEHPTLFSERQKTVYDRINIMAATLRVIADRPLLGVGYGRLGEEYPRYWRRTAQIPLRGKHEGNHNVPLGVAAEVGAPAALCYLGIFWALIRRSVGFYRSAGPGQEAARGLTLAYLACLASYLVNMQTLDVRWNMAQNVMIFVLAGMVMALARDGLSGGQREGRA